VELEIDLSFRAARLFFYWCDFLGGLVLVKRKEKKRNKGFTQKDATVFIPL